MKILRCPACQSDISAEINAAVAKAYRNVAEWCDSSAAGESSTPVNDMAWAGAGDESRGAASAFRMTADKFRRMAAIKEK